MKININNQDKIEKLLKTESGKLKSVVSYSGIINAAKYYDEKVFSRFRGVKTLSIGAQICINGFSGILPNAYNYHKQYQYVVIEKFSSGWFVVVVDRTSASTGEVVNYHSLYLPEDAKNLVKDELYKDITNNTFWA